MKIVTLLVLAIAAAGALSACGSSNSAPAAASPGTTTVQGLSTPRSVSVVTAN
jgi:ABC-type glycerol-3-phosphate transport system substrate-binding protein